MATLRIDFTDGWYYDYEEMTIYEQLRAKTYWQLFFRGLELMPSTLTEEQIFLQEMNEINAYASLLKKDEEYTFEEAKEYLKKVKGGEVATKLEEAKMDFFGKPIIGQIVSQFEFKNFIEILKKMPEFMQSEILNGMLHNVPEVLKMLGENYSRKT